MNNPTLEQFLKDIASHQLTVNLDQGVFRDLTIANPNTMEMHYNITTRPGYLMITGDMGDFIFKRTNDMFRFFRPESGYYINPSYWGEKVEAKVFHAESIASSFLVRRRGEFWKGAKVVSR